MNGKIVQLICDDKGGTSSIRLAMVVVIFITMVESIFVTLKTGLVADVPGGLLALIAALITGKTIQKQVEKEPKK